MPILATIIGALVANGKALLRTRECIIDLLQALIVEYIGVHRIKWHRGSNR